jgi:hypothetical protein
MMRLLLLVLWSSSGILAAVVLTPREVGRLAWLPTAGIFGPLWLAIAFEQNRDDR